MIADPLIWIPSIFMFIPINWFSFNGHVPYHFFPNIFLKNCKKLLVTIYTLDTSTQGSFSCPQNIIFKKLKQSFRDQQSLKWSISGFDFISLGQKHNQERKLYFLVKTFSCLKTATSLIAENVCVYTFAGRMLTALVPKEASSV